MFSFFFFRWDMWPVQYPYIVRAKNYFLVTGPVHYPYVVRTKSKILFNGPYICPYMYGPCTGHVEGRAYLPNCLTLLEFAFNDQWNYVKCFYDDVVSCIYKAVFLLNILSFLFICCWNYKKACFWMDIP